MTTHRWPDEVRLADPWRWQSPALRFDWTPSPYLSPCRCSPSNAHYHLLWDWEGNQPLFLLQLSTGCEILSSNDALFAFKLLITIKTIDFGDRHFILFCRHHFVNIVSPILFPPWSGGTACVLCVHPRCSHYLDQLKPCDLIKMVV